MRHIATLMLLLFVAITFGDVIYLKNGVMIEGQITSVGKDSVTIKLAIKEIKIAIAEIERIETVPTEKPAVTEQGIPKSIRQVGYGCLGGVVGGAVGGCLTIWADGFDDAKIATTVVLGSIIIGIIIGIAAGGGR